MLPAEQSLFDGLLGKLQAQRAALVARAGAERVQIARLKQNVGDKLVQVVPRLNIELDSVAGLEAMAFALAR